MYRAMDTGLRSIDLRTLDRGGAEPGANWGTTLVSGHLPEHPCRVLSGAFLTFAIVVGEFTLGRRSWPPAFGPYMEPAGRRDRAYEPSALAIISFALTWGGDCAVGRGAPGPRLAGPLEGVIET